MDESKSLGKKTPLNCRLSLIRDHFSAKAMKKLTATLFAQQIIPQVWRMMKNKLFWHAQRLNSVNTENLSIFIAVGLAKAIPNKWNHFNHVVCQNIKYTIVIKAKEKKKTLSNYLNLNIIKP